MLAGTFPDAELDRGYATQPVPGFAAEGPAELELRYLGASNRPTSSRRCGARRSQEELWIVDQHVAHSRILFERLFLRRHAVAVQPLLPPKVLGLGPAAMSRLAPFLEEMNTVGIEVEAFGADALVVRGLPDFLAERDPEALLTDLLHRMERGGKPDLDAFRRDLNAELACRAAIKKHERLSPALAQQLIADLMACEVPQTCPHGRPDPSRSSPWGNWTAASGGGCEPAGNGSGGAVRAFQGPPPASTWAAAAPRPRTGSMLTWRSFRGWTWCWISMPVPGSIPLPDGCIEGFSLSHVLEHISNVLPLPCRNSIASRRTGPS